MLHNHRSLQVRRREISENDDPTVIEGRFSIFFNDSHVTDIIASNDQLRELGAGFVITEGLTLYVDKVKLDGDRICVYSDPGCGVFRKKTIGSSGGMSIQDEPGIISSDIRITPEDIVTVNREIDTEVWRKTGAAHCAVLFNGKKCIVKSSDVVRLNTVDKVVGHAILNGIDLSQCIIGCSGKQHAGMVKKGANAGIPIVISRAASTNKGIETAKKSGITLVRFSHGDRFTIYTHPERIHGAGIPVFR